jgi:hypothetical protein
MKDKAGNMARRAATESKARNYADSRWRFKPTDTTTRHKEKYLQPFVLMHLHGQFLVLQVALVLVSMVQFHVVLNQKIEK